CRSDQHHRCGVGRNSSQHDTYDYGRHYRRRRHTPPHSREMGCDAAYHLGLDYHDTRSRRYRCSFLLVYSITEVQMKSIRLAMLVIFIASLATVVFAQKTGSLQRIKIHSKPLEGNLENLRG